MPLNVYTESAAEVIAQTRDVSRSEMAAVAILTYDIMITFGDEVEMIWRRQWTFAKGMYIAARYIPWIFELALIAINADGTTGLFFSEPDCRRWIIVQGVILQLIISTVDIVLMTRVYALYNRNLRLMTGLGLLFLGEVAYMIYVLTVVTPRLVFNADCFVISSPKIFINYWIVSLIFETILFSLTLFKFGEAMWNGWGKRPVMKQFVRDGTWAYTLIFIAMLINSLFYKLVHSPLAGICFTWLLTVLSYAGSRLILNPRVRTLPSVNTQTTGIELDHLPPVSPISPATERSPVTPSTPTFLTAVSPGRSAQSKYKSSEDSLWRDGIEISVNVEVESGMV
ncbi:hypothetical protein BXZ70DRAFT_493784 [Cristinia sonorae]|uniref:DUF6533 domain-containing protein n=1 Tax=Cristinia sonorae TaxID=1940300 RepID=A0A8K0UHD5_9AGAR|nr:hypothetical protein BXZ70DRAFT_493784 [Cristinia sonorae]